MGGLYVGDTANKVDCYDPLMNESKNFIFDDRTGNVHLVPEHKELAEKYSNEICEKRIEIMTSYLIDFQEQEMKMITWMK